MSTTPCTTFVNGVNPFIAAAKFHVEGKPLREFPAYVKPGPKLDPESTAGRIRAYLEANPFKSAAEIADAIGIDKATCSTKCNNMTVTGQLESTEVQLDGSNRDVRHFSVKEE